MTRPHEAPRVQARRAFQVRLRDKMTEKCWRQSDLARATGLGRDSISSYLSLRCQTIPSDLALRKIADALGVLPEWLLPHRIDPTLSNLGTLEMRQVDGQPGKVWLTLNQVVDMETALIVLDIMRRREEEN